MTNLITGVILESKQNRRARCITAQLATASADPPTARLGPHSVSRMPRRSRHSTPATHEAKRRSPLPSGAGSRQTSLQSQRPTSTELRPHCGAARGPASPDRHSRAPPHHSRKSSRLALRSRAEAVDPITPSRRRARASFTPGQSSHLRPFPGGARLEYQSTDMRAGGQRCGPVQSGRGSSRETRVRRISELRAADNHQPGMRGAFDMSDRGW